MKCLGVFRKSLLILALFVFTFSGFTSVVGTDSSLSWEYNAAFDQLQLVGDNLCFYIKSSPDELSYIGCLDASNGKLKWSNSKDQKLVTDFLIHEEAALFFDCPDTSGNYSLVSLNLNDGSENWRTSYKYRIDNMDISDIPLLGLFEDKVYFQSGKFLIELCASSGKETKKIDLSSETFIGTLKVVDKNDTHLCCVSGLSNSIYVFNYESGVLEDSVEDLQIYYPTRIYLEKNYLFFSMNSDEYKCEPYYSSFLIRRDIYSKKEKKVCSFQTSTNNFLTNRGKNLYFGYVGCEDSEYKISRVCKETSEVLETQALDISFFMRSHSVVRDNVIVYSYLKSGNEKKGFSIIDLQLIKQKTLFEWNEKPIAMEANDNYFVFSDKNGTYCYSLNGVTSDEQSLTFQINQNSYTINNETMKMDTTPVIVNNRTLLPARYVCEPLGGQVFWDGDERKVTCKLVAPDNYLTEEYKENIVELWIGKSTAKINGQEVQIDPNNSNVVPTIINDRTMVPMRFLAESLGCEVKWVAETKEIILTYPNE